MKSATRLMLAFIAMATFVLLTNCSKNSKDVQIESTFQQLVEEKNSLASKNSTSSTTGSYRLLPNSLSNITVPALCGSVTKNFIIGTVNYGNIVVGNDDNNYYFTITGTNGWMLKKVRLYAGDEASIPLNGGGLPQFNEYPVDQSFSSPYPTSWSFSVPVADLGNNFWVSARVDYINGTGTEAGAWSEGDAFKAGNPASKFNCLQYECVLDEGCALGQGYWFGNGNHAWPDVNAEAAGVVTIGNENYTRDEARAIWWSNNGSCPGIADAKKAFAFVAAIKLSGASVIGNDDLWNDLTTADNWLSSLDRLTDTNICSHPAAPANVKDAVARLGAWMDEHKCD